MPPCICSLCIEKKKVQLLCINFSALPAFFSQTSYTASESEGFVEVCVVLSGGRIDRTLTVNLFIADGPATGKSQEIHEIIILFIYLLIL